MRVAKKSHRQLFYVVSSNQYFVCCVKFIGIGHLPLPTCLIISLLLPNYFPQKESSSAIIYYNGLTVSIMPLVFLGH